MRMIMLYCNCSKKNNKYFRHNLDSKRGFVYLIEDLTGKKFNKWNVIKKVEDKYDKWLCSCECGSSEREVSSYGLTTGHSKSCGCSVRVKNGMSSTRIHQIYAAMISRCYNNKVKAYKDYGGRGITVCQEWKDDFFNFHDWASINGYTEKLTIDRIDVNGNYEPDNCRWATMKEQANNRTSNVLIEINGVIHNMEEWARLYDLPPSTIKGRLNRGWTGADIIIPANTKMSNKVKVVKERKYGIGIQSGVKGITWNKEIRKWQVKSRTSTGNQKYPKYLGSFENLSDAIKIKDDFDIKNK